MINFVIILPEESWRRLATDAAAEAVAMATKQRIIIVFVVIIVGVVVVESTGVRLLSRDRKTRFFGEKFCSFKVYFES